MKKNNSKNLSNNVVDNIYNDSYKDYLKVLEIIIVILSLIFVSYLSFKFLCIFVNGLKYLFDNYTTIAVAIVTGLLTFFSAVIAKIIEKKIMIDNQIRSERQKIYVDFLNWIISSLLYNDNKSDLVEETKKYQKLMTIYASDNVLKAWSIFKYKIINSVLNDKKMSKEEKTKIFIQTEAIYLEKLILEMRRDLGYQNKNLKKFDILKIYINDFDDYF